MTLPTPQPASVEDTQFELLVSRVDLAGAGTAMIKHLCQVAEMARRLADEVDQRKDDIEAATPHEKAERYSWAINAIANFDRNVGYAQAVANAAKYATAQTRVAQFEAAAGETLNAD